MPAVRIAVVFPLCQTLCFQCQAPPQVAKPAVARDISIIFPISG